MNLDQDVMVLRSVPLFASFGMEQLRLIAFGAETIDVPAGSTLFSEGAPADGGYLLLSGDMELKSQETGKATALSGAGSLIGEIAILTDVSRPATATCVTDCRLMILSRRLVLRVLEEYPAMAEVLKMSLTERLADLTSELRRIQPAFAEK